MKKALKIGIGICGIGYVICNAFMLGSALPLVNALLRGKTEEANCISNNIIGAYGHDSFITDTILELTMCGLNFGFKIAGSEKRVTYTKN